jgi:hypothetical protein
VVGRDELNLDDLIVTDRNDMRVSNRSKRRERFLSVPGAARKARRAFRAPSLAAKSNVSIQPDTDSGRVLSGAGHRSTRDCGNAVTAIRSIFNLLAVTALPTE